MDISGLLKTFISKEQLEGIASQAGVSTEGTTSALSAVASLFANKAADGSVTVSTLESLAGDSSTETLITTLLGAGGAKAVAERSGLSQPDTDNILSAATPLVLSALTGSDSKEKANILKMVSGFADGSPLDKITSLFSGKKADDAAEEKQDGEEKSSGLLGMLGGLFGKK